MIAQSIRLYRNAFRGLSPSVWLLGGVMLINRSGSMVLPYLTLYLTQHLHYSVAQAGVVMAVFGVGSLAGSALGGWLTDRFGFYPVQFWSLTGAGLFLIGLQFVTHFYGICGMVFALTLVGDAFRPANSTAVAHYSSDDTRTRAYSLNRLAINLGWSVGAGLGGFLAGIDYQLLFWFDGLTCLIAALVLRMALPAPATVRPAVHSANASVLPARSPYRDGFYLVFVVCTALFGTAFFQLFGMAPLYFKQILRLTETQIGLLMTMNGLLVVAVEMALVYAVEQRLRAHKIRLISGGVLLTGFSYLLLEVGGWPGLAVLCVLLATVSEMLAMPFMQSFAVERADIQSRTSARRTSARRTSARRTSARRTSGRGQYLALYSMAYAVAQITAPALGSQVVERGGFSVLWWVVMGLSVASATGFWWLSGRLRTEVTTDATVP